MTESGFKDHFSSAAADYATYRPRYPSALFDFVASLALKHRAAWDCATGNGQAAFPLADRFEQVFATDASAAQIAHAVPHPRVRYSVARADASGLEPGSVDVVTVAQALHWLPHDAFFAEVRRVLAPGGVLAAWCYTRPRVGEGVDPVIERYYAETCGPYWPPEREHVNQGYRSIPMPIDEVRPPALSMELPMTLDEFAGYLRTWSATQALAAAIGRDPVVEVRDELRAVWGDPGVRRLVRWPLHVRAGRVVGT